MNRTLEVILEDLEAKGMYDLDIQATQQASRYLFRSAPRSALPSGLKTA